MSGFPAIILSSLKRFYEHQVTYTICQVSFLFPSTIDDGTNMVEFGKLNAKYSSQYFNIKYFMTLLVIDLILNTE